MNHEPCMLACDYQETACEQIIQALANSQNTNYTGYGTDVITKRAKDKIRQAIETPDAEIEFLIGGTQTNQVVIGALLASYQGVIAADTGHVAVHEAGAIEITGHKVLALPSRDGKISAKNLETYMETFENDGNKDHMVMPGMVYLSQPTEFGTLYSKQELTEIMAICQSHDLKLYIDGARLAYALAAPENDVSLPDLAQLCDVFYIGGTKCGAMFGEAVVVPDPKLIPHFFTIIKQRGALLAKGWLLGIQFDQLFSDNLYQKLAEPAIKQANQIRKALTTNGYQLLYSSPTNQTFFIMDNQDLPDFGQKVGYSFWDKYDDRRTIIRLATSWSTSQDDVDQVCAILADFKK
ncbi:threonine aldolase family protein [Lactobacillus equicursoris]|uniref:threonine aldolase family protein n=1 Tax=Lactobacillus equicursoris TaxID=420645 RepID=UPI0039959498